MSLIMYERVGLGGRRPSPYSWRVRYALTHKGLPVEYRPTRFADVGMIEELSGQRFVPILLDGATVVHDSWQIALHLEERFPERPSLFGGAAALAPTRFINEWSAGSLQPAIRRIICADFVRCLAPEDQGYYRQTREQSLGQSLEAAAADTARNERELELVCRALENYLAHREFLGGEQPSYADYIVFSDFQWARLGSPRELLPDGSSIAGWRQRMCALYDGLADTFPAHPDSC